MNSYCMDMISPLSSAATATAGRLPAPDSAMPRSGPADVGTRLLPGDGPSPPRTERVKVFCSTVVLPNALAALTTSFAAISLGAAFGVLGRPTVPGEPGGGALKGILSAGIIALVTGAGGGTKVQCSGPTAPMAAVFTVISEFARSGGCKSTDLVFQPELTTEAACLAADDGNTWSDKGLRAEQPDISPQRFLNTCLLMAGACIFLCGLLRTGRFISVVPGVVISGFMNGIAMLIWRGELFSLFGFGGNSGLSGRRELNVSICAFTFALTMLLPRLCQRLCKPDIARKVPTVLIVLVAVSLASLPLSNNIALTNLGGDCEGGEATCQEFLTQPQCNAADEALDCTWTDSRISSFEDLRDILERNVPWSDWSSDPIILWVAAPFVLELTLLAYLDTILTTLVVDKLLKAKGVWDKPTAKNRELGAQGAANAIVASFGGVPGAQSTTVSVLNINEGGTNRLAGTLVGVFILIEMIIFQDLIAYIPAAVFSGILIKVGYDIFDWKPQIELGRRLWWRWGWCIGSSTEALQARYLVAMAQIAQSRVPRAPLDTRVVPRAQIMEARRCALELRRRGGSKAAQSCATQAGEGAEQAFCAVWAEQQCCDDPHVSASQEFFIAGTTLVTLFWNLNYAVMIFTATYHIARISAKRLPVMCRSSPALLTCIQFLLPKRMDDLDMEHGPEQDLVPLEGSFSPCHQQRGQDSALFDVGVRVRPRYPATSAGAQGTIVAVEEQEKGTASKFRVREDEAGIDSDIKEWYATAAELKLVEDEAPPLLSTGAENEYGETPGCCGTEEDPTCIRICGTLCGIGPDGPCGCFKSETRDRRGSVQADGTRKRLNGKATASGAIFNMCNCMFGVGVLTLPSALNSVGILLGLVLILLCGALVCAVFLLINSALEMCPSATTYSGLLTDSLGRRWSLAYDAWIVLTVFGTTVAWNSTIANLSENLALDVGFISAGQVMIQGLENRQVFVLASSFFVLWPLVAIPTFHKLRSVSGLALFAMVFVAFVISLRALQEAARQGLPCREGVGLCWGEDCELPGTEDPAPCDTFATEEECEAAGGDEWLQREACEPIALWVWSTQIFNALSTFAFSFDVGPSHVPILSELKDRTKSKGVVVILSTIALACALYAFVGGMGYLHFTDRVCSNVIETYTGDGLMATGKGMVVFSIIGSYPTATLATRLSLEQLVPSWRPDATKTNGNLSCVRGAAVTTTILAISATASLFVDDLGQIVQFVGAISGFGLFVLPCVVYVNLKYKDRPPLQRMYTWVGALTIIGLFLVMANFTITVQNLIEEGLRDDDGSSPTCGLLPPPPPPPPEAWTNSTGRLFGQ